MPTVSCPVDTSAHAPVSFLLPWPSVPVPPRRFMPEAGRGGEGRVVRELGGGGGGWRVGVGEVRG